MTILLVDDNEQDLYQLQVLLAASGYQVVTARDGAEALRQARQAPPDLIVSDILMPVMDGFALCREWQQDARLQTIPFIFYTATYTDERDRELALGLGVRRFIVKPEAPEVFLHAVAQAIKEAAPVRAAPVLETPARLPVATPDDAGFLKQYNAALIRKLEAKMQQLEQIRRELERDIAARQAAETRYRALFEQSPDGIVILDPETTRPLEFNEAAHRQLGYSREEFARLRLAEIDATETEEEIRRRIDGVRRAKRTDFETRHRTRQGEIRDVHVTVQVVEILGHSVFHNVWRDITERKRAAAVLALQARIATIFLTVPDEEMFNEVLKVILDVTHSPFGVFGYLDEAGALVVPTMTRQIWDKCQVPDKTIIFPRAAWGDSSWPRAIREKKANYSNEGSTQAPAGHIAVTRHISLPILFQDEVIGLFQVANKETDYTEADVRTLEAIAGQTAPLLSARLWRDRAEQTLRKLNAELEQRVRERTAQLEAANKELEGFSYSVSHDLRAPLRAIDGYARILREDYEVRLDAEGRRLLGVVCAAAERMNQLIDDLLTFARTSRQTLNCVAVDLGALAQAAYDQCAAQEPGRRFQFRLQPLPPAQGDPALLQQVLVNLIANAVKYSRPRPVAEIEVGSRGGDGEVVYFVKDNGVGFDPKYTHKLFGVFQRLHRQEEFEGTGVGLALVQRIILRHGGRVWAEGKLGEGTTVYFTLPAKVDV